MTDKMSDIWNAHDTARNKAWREEPGTFNTLDAFKAGAAWQAAQAEQSVPVVGEVVLWALCEGKTLMYTSSNRDAMCANKNMDKYTLVPLVVQPTHSITTAELDRLQEGEACAETVLEAALVKFPDAPTEFECIGKMAAEVVRRYNAELERLRKDAERVPGGMIPVFEVGTGWLTPHHQERGTILYAAAIAAEGEKG